MRRLRQVPVHEESKIITANEADQHHQDYFCHGECKDMMNDSPEGQTHHFGPCSCGVTHEDPHQEKPALSLSTLCACLNCCKCGKRRDTHTTNNRECTLCSVCPEPSGWEIGKPCLCLVPCPECSPKTETPMGVSAWKAHGEKYKYDEYFGIKWPQE